MRLLAIGKNVLAIIKNWESNSNLFADDTNCCIEHIGDKLANFDQIHYALFMAKNETVFVKLYVNTLINDANLY